MDRGNFRKQVGFLKTGRTGKKKTNNNATQKKRRKI